MAKLNNTWISRSIIMAIGLGGPAPADARNLNTLRFSISNERIPCRLTTVVGASPTTMCKTRHEVAFQNAGGEPIDIEIFCGHVGRSEGFKLLRQIRLGVGQRAEQSILDSFFPDEKTISSAKSSCFIRTNYGRAKLY